MANRRPQYIVRRALKDCTSKSIRFRGGTVYAWETVKSFPIRFLAVEAAMKLTKETNERHEVFFCGRLSRP